MVRLNVKFHKVAFSVRYFWPLRRQVSSGRVCSENIIRYRAWGGGGGCCNNNRAIGWCNREHKRVVIKPGKMCRGCNPALQTSEGGVGERRTQGPGVSCWVRWRDAEVDEGAVLWVFFFAFLFKWAIAVGSFFFFFFSFFLFGSPLQTDE